MTMTVSPPEQDDGIRQPGMRVRLVRGVLGVMEALVLALTALAPWAFGAVDPPYEFLLYSGVAALLTLWAARTLLEGRLIWQRCPLAVCLAALFVCAAGQLLPLPHGLLARLTPATARLYERLLPARPEALPFGEERGTPAAAPGSTLSVYPHATHRQAVQLLAVFLLFAAVRNNVASAAALRRLSVVAVANGALLSLFGLVQFFSSPAHLLYWAYPAEQQVFGPFINRDHFAFYANLCVGLGVGLLLSQEPHSTDWPSWRARVALALALGGGAFCLSWGSLAAICAGSLVCLTVQLSSSRQLGRRTVALATFAVALAGVLWLALGRSETLPAVVGKDKEATVDQRPLWARSLPVVKAFPLWGTGFGTFSYVIPRPRNSAVVTVDDRTSAANGYLGALVEGGVVRLTLSLLAVGLVFRLGYWAFRRHEDGPAGGLALGVLFAFTTLVVHSLVAPGLQVPAIAVLATVFCAQLAALGGREGRRSSDAAASTKDGIPSQFSRGLGGMAPFLAAVVAVVLGLVLCGEGWRAQKAHTLRVAASRLESSPDTAYLLRRLSLLRAAAQTAPGDAPLQLILARAHAHLFEIQMEELRTNGQVTEVGRTVLAWSGLGSLAPATHPAWVAGSCWLAGASAWDQQIQAEEKRLLLRHQVPALRHCLQARDACPLWAECHLLLAEQAGNLDNAEGRGAYLERAKLVAADDPRVWYRCGIQEIDDDQKEQAWKSWRRSLELSDRYLLAILDRSAEFLDPPDILRTILPDRPGLLAAAALHLFPGTEFAAERERFLEEARAAREQTNRAVESTGPP